MPGEEEDDGGHRDAVHDPAAVFLMYSQIGPIIKGERLTHSTPSSGLLLEKSRRDDEGWRSHGRG